jgi:hypothetical protein
VWIWVRALDKIINITPFINSANISKSDSGIFSLNISPLDDLGIYYDIGGDNMVNYFNIRKSNGHTQNDFFTSNIQYNDIVFIRFEKLKLEPKGSDNPFFEFEIGKNKLPGQVWDMIGLVDSISSNVDFNSSDFSISIAGRDLYKLLIEDASYFLSLAYIIGESNSIIDIYNKEDKWFKRMGVSNGDNGWYNPNQYQFLSSQRSISDSIGFIVNQLSNLGVIGDSDLFSYYGDKRTAQYKILETKGEVKASQTEVQGLWQIVKFFIDEAVDRRRIVDHSLAYSDGTMLEQFNKLCQQPFVEFYGDTYGDEFNFVIRQPPFNKDAIVSFLDADVNYRSSLVQDSRVDIQDRTVAAKVELEEIVIKADRVDYILDIDEGSVASLNLQWDDTYYSWYQVTPAHQDLAKYSLMPSGGLIPNIYFSYIAETFGNHRKIVQDNYLDMDIANNFEAFRNTLLNDLKYLIDTNIYLPFTRKGTIILSHGDRRIKKGTFIRLIQTSEIFYVDSVSNSISFSGSGIDRSTTITVSRGMVEKYIKGSIGFDRDGHIINKNGDPIRFSYFNIVNTDLISKTIIDQNIVDKEKLSIQYKEGYNDISKAAEAYRYLVERYFPSDQIENALRIMQAESSGIPSATNINKDYSIDEGLFQINSRWHPEVRSGGNVFDPEYNIRSAATIWKNRGWKEWATSKLQGVIHPTTKKDVKQKTDNLQSSSINKTINRIETNFALDRDQFEFFLKRNQMNLFKEER